MKGKWTTVIAAVALVLAMTAGAAFAAETILYQENFNSGTALQSITATPFNWTAVSGDIKIGNVGHTGWDGLHISGYDTYAAQTTADNRAQTGITVPTSGTLRLSFDAWTMTYGASQGEIALLDPASSSWPLKWVVGGGGWLLYHGFNLGSNWFYAGVDKGFHIDTYIDLDNSQFWGTITDDTGPHSSPVMSFEPGHTAYDLLQIQCYTGSVWDRLDVDNIVLARTPPAGTGPGTLSGHVELQDYDPLANRALSPVEIKLTPTPDGTARTELVVLPPSGNYTIEEVDPGTYSVSFSACKWLRRVVTGVTVPPGGSAPPCNASLINGSVDGDNGVTTTDLSVVLANMGTSGE